MTTLRIIGIDLAVTAAHRAIVLDSARNEFISPIISISTNSADLDRLLERAQAGAPAGTRLIAVLEATNMAWFSIGTYLHRHGVEVFRVNGRQTADQRRVHYRHAKSDRIDARVLPRLYLNAPERICPLFFPPGAVMELQRACREMVRLSGLISATKNRLRSTDRFAWLGWPDELPGFDPAAGWLRRHWYNPWSVCQAGREALKQAWQEASADESQDLGFLSAWVEQAQQVQAFYGDPPPIDYPGLQAFVSREQERLAAYETQKRFVQLKVVRRLYRKLYPKRLLESLPGVGQDSAAIYQAFVGDIQRFPSLGNFLGWSGMIPFSSQSGESQAKGLHITQAGPDLIKRTAFLDASIARLYDPQIAAVYYEQMMNKGKHYLQAICACATHLLTRVYVVLREQRPYVLRDAQGNPITKEAARLLCQEHYCVPAEVRQRNNHRVRKQRAEERLEQRTQRRHQKQRSKG